MSYIDKLTLGGTTYDLQDTAAQTALASQSEDINNIQGDITDLNGAVGMLEAGSLSALNANRGDAPIAHGDGTWDWLTLGFVTPEMYGAKGDGTTDDTAAINAAISGNAFVLFTADKYVVSGEIELHSDLTLYSGKKSCIYMADNSDYGFINASDLQNVNIENIDFDINPDGQQQKHTAIKFINSQFIKLEAITVGEMFDDETYDVNGNCNFTECQNIIINDCCMHGSCAENLIFVDCSDVNISGGEYYNARYGSAIVTNGTRFHLYGIYVHDTDGSGISYNSSNGSIIGCTVKNVNLNETQVNGITVGHSRQANGDNSVVLGNIIENAPNGIGVSASNYVTVENNTIIGAEDLQTQYGVRTVNQAYHTVVRGNTIIGCNHGISPTNNTIIYGNKISECDIGIALGACQNCVVDSNECFDNVTAGIDDLNSNAPQNKFINNVCSNSSNGSQQIGIRVRSSNCIAAFNTCLNNTSTDCYVASISVALYNRTSNQTKEYDATIYDSVSSLYVNGTSLKTRLDGLVVDRKDNNQMFCGAFNNLSDNPFPTLTLGMFIAIRNTGFANGWYCIGFFGTQIEVGVL